MKKQQEYCYRGSRESWEVSKVRKKELKIRGHQAQRKPFKALNGDIFSITRRPAFKLIFYSLLHTNAVLYPNILPISFRNFITAF
jgi:hypothetical protein